MRGITEDEYTILVAVVLFILALAALMGMFPVVGKIVPSIYSSLFRIIDMFKDKIAILRYI